MFFAKGEIIMNNIYKVIWSKAKNCYVVASEIARSHTKSASGSEKIGGDTGRKLLASLMVLSLLCGGLGVAEASVHVNEVGGGTSEVYTTSETYKKTEVDLALAAKGAADDVATNKAAIIDLKNAVGNAGSGLTKEVSEQKAAIAANTTALDGKANKADVYSKAEVDTAVAGAVATAGTNVDTKLADYAKTAELDTKLAGKADKATTLAGYGIADAYSKGEVDNALNNKADKATTLAGYGIADAYTKGEVDNALNKKADKATTLAGYGITDAYTKAEVNTAVAGAVTTAGTNVDAKLADYAKTTYVDTEVGKKADKATTLAGYGITDAYTKSQVSAKLNQKADKTDLTQAQTAIDGLNKKTTKITYDASNGTSVDGVTFNAGAVTGVTSINGTEIGTKESGTYIHQDSSIWGNMKKVDTQVKTNADNIETNKNDITKLDAKVGTVSTGTYLDPTKSVGENLGLLDAGLKQETADRKAAIGELAVNGNYIEKDKNVSDNLVKLDNQAKANADEIVKTNERTGGITRNTEKTQTTIEGSVKVDKQGNVKDVKGLSAETITTTGNADLKGNVILGTNTANTVTVNGNADFNAAVKMNNGLNVTNGETNLKKTTVDGDLKVTGTITTDKMVFGDPATNNYTEIDHGKVTSKNLVVNGAGQTISSSSTFDVEKNEVGFTNTATGDHSYYKQTAKGINGYVTDKDGNKTYTKITATENSFQVQDKDGKNKNHQVNTKDSSVTEITNGDGKTTKTEQTATDITNTAKDGTITNDANHIVNNANTMDTTVTGKATESYGELDTTVNGQATENFNGGLNTKVTGAENHTVTGKQTNTVGGGQENIISGGQFNTITGDQTTTVTGKVTEDYKAGQATNVTGDQDITVSGTQTTTATDINRNASSSMVDKVDNAYGTNTETKVAGKTTTDVSIKGTGEKGQYIRGANESRDYLIKGTLKNSETKTAEVTSTEITDGTNTASTRQDAKNLAGSVTNGTETGISGIHANDDGSVSIDSAVAGGGMSSVINQKKDSIQSAVGDGTNSTVIHQDKDNVTIASFNGTVGIVGKDIVNNAQNTITNTAGTSITNQVNDSKVTTDANGTTFENNTPAVSDGGATTTKINGNQITTGRVNANELGVSDKDGANTADFSVEAGEGKGVNASAGNGTTTGSLDVTAEEVSSSVKDASGKGSTFKQRIDKIMMESKDVSIKAEETLTNEAKVITNKASEVINNEAVNINNTATGIITSKASEIKNQADKLISNKVGENTWENMENGKITTSIKDGAKQNLTQSNAAGTTQSTVDGGKSTVTIQNADGLADAVTDGRNTSVQNQTASAIAADVKDGAGNENASVSTATTSANTIKSGSKANTVISTVDGTSFTNSEAAAPVTGASGAGTAVNTTIKGNTITTGKVTMDYADVMKDLGVRGNANITGKTTTGSLKVKGESKLTGDVTMGSNATVEKDLTVKGITTTKTLNVTEDAKVGRDLAVGGNATITGDVTANSYKVGDKTYISAAGINANDQKITNVADGSISEGSKDAVNGGQLYGVKRDLEHQVDKVGANAAAMANLRPMEFDPSSKWNIAAAIGNYGSETAAAIGAFYRPNDNVMVNLSTAFGTGENMVGGGVSVRLGKGGNKLSREETNALKAQVADLTARMDALLSVLNPNMSKDFPDVPENHWAYEAVSRLAGNDIVQGYPDGEFHGERTMTRYEMAEIIYNALSRGAEAEKELVEEFKPELQAMAASEKATAEKAEG